MTSTVTVTSITSDLVQEVFTDAFRAEVGHGKRFSRAQVSEATGFDSATVNSYMDGKSCPSTHKLLRLMALFGPRFANRMLQVAGLGDAVRLDHDGAGILDVNAAAAKLTAKVAEDLADDGRIDHQEEAEQERIIAELHERTGDYLKRRAERRSRLRRVV